MPKAIWGDVEGGKNGFDRWTHHSINIAHWFVKTSIVAKIRQGYINLTKDPKASNQRISGSLRIRLMKCLKYNNWIAFTNKEK
jgi:hypothetical protein